MKAGMTLVELLVVLVIIMFVMLAIYTYFPAASKFATQTVKRLSWEENLNMALDILRDDIRHSSFGLRKRGNGIVGECLLYVDDSCSGPENFCKAGTDRLFLGNGWQIIRDFTLDHCPDGIITLDRYKDLLSKDLSESGFSSNITSWDSSFVTLYTLNIDNRDRKGSGYCGDNDDDGADFHDGESLILCGCDNGTNFAARISSRNGSVLGFHSKEHSLTVNCTYAIPAVVWYIRKNDGEWWLYRNEARVIEFKGLIPDFQVKIGCGGRTVDTIRDCNETVNFIEVCLGYSKNVDECCSNSYSECQKFIIREMVYY